MALRGLGNGRVNDGKLPSARKAWLSSSARLTPFSSPTFDPKAFCKTAEWPYRQRYLDTIPAVRTCEITGPTPAIAIV